MNPNRRRGKKRLIPNTEQPPKSKKPKSAEAAKPRKAPSPLPSSSSSSSSNESNESESGASSAPGGQLDFDFEALPPAEEDLQGIVALLQQIFLRRPAPSTKDAEAEDPLEALAKRIVEQAPRGCVFRPPDEDDDEGGDEVEGKEEDAGTVYGVMSVVELDEKISSFIRTHLLDKAKKHATDAEIRRQLQEALTHSSETTTGLIINERLLRFPAQIAGPAFKSLISDIDSTPSLGSLDKVLMVLKVRIADPLEPNQPSTSAAQVASAAAKKDKKKLGKAAKKRLAAQKLTEAEVVFDNAEEALLFGPDVSATLPYFQYPVQSDVERDSEFHSSLIDGRLYKAYRRVVLMSMAQFKAFAQRVVEIYS